MPMYVRENTAGDFGEDLVIPGKGDTVILLKVVWVQLGAADKDLLHDFLRDHLSVFESIKDRLC